MTLRLAQSLTLPEQPGSASKPTLRIEGAWLTLDQAAERSGLSVGQLRRKCLEIWEGQGTARKVNTGVARASWQISESADPAFARVAFPEQLDARTSQLANVSDQQRELALKRKETLDRWLQARSAGVRMGMTEAEVTERFLVAEQHIDARVSRASLYNWNKAYRQSGILGLVDQRSTPQASTKQKDSDTFFVTLREAYLSDRRPSIRSAYDTACYQTAKEDPDRSLPAYVTAKRYLQSLPPQVLIAKREGQKAYNDKCAPYVQRDYSSLQSNDIWCGDHHRFDVMVNFGKNAEGKPVHGRPWLTAWQDLASRRIVAWHITAENPNTDTILRSLKRGFAAHGLPKSLMVDNGRDFAARALHGTTKRQRRMASKITQDSAQSRSSEIHVDESRVLGVLQILDISYKPVQAYHGQSKPVERFFGTLCDRFSRTFETYTGRNTLEKPESLERHVSAGRAVDLADFVKDFEDWLESDYHSRVHTGEGMSGQTPVQAFSSNLTAKRVVSQEMLDFACLQRYGPVKVGRHGVRWQGMNFGAFDDQVIKLYRQKVLLAVDDSDLSRVLVLSTDGRLICRASQNVKLSFHATSDEVRAALNEKRRISRIRKSYDQIRPLIGISGDMASGVSDAAASRHLRSRGTTPDERLTPPALKAHRTGFEDQAEPIRQALTGTDSNGGGGIDPRSLLGSNDDDSGGVPPLRFDPRDWADTEDAS